MSIVEMLERLTQAKDKSQFNQIMGGYQTAYRNNMEMLRTIELMKELKDFGKRRWK